MQIKTLALSSAPPAIQLYPLSLNVWQRLTRDYTKFIENIIEYAAKSISNFAKVKKLEKFLNVENVENHFPSKYKLTAFGAEFHS